MRLLGNILWHFPCFGFVTSLFSFLAGILLTVTVVGAPHRAWFDSICQVRSRSVQLFHDRQAGIASQ